MYIFTKTRIQDPSHDYENCVWVCFYSIYRKQLMHVGGSLHHIQAVLNVKQYLKTRLPCSGPTMFTMLSLVVGLLFIKITWCCWYVTVTNHLHLISFCLRSRKKPIEVPLQQTNINMKHHIFEYKGNTSSNGYLFIVMLFFGGVTMMMIGGVCDIFLYLARMFNPFFMNLYSLCWTHPPQGGAVWMERKKRWIVHIMMEPGSKTPKIGRLFRYICLYIHPEV